MSATNRNGLARQPNDFYETPAWAIDAALDYLRIGSEFDGYVIDPGCGTGAIAERVAARAPKADVRGVEKDEACLEKAKVSRAPGIAWELADWLTWQPDGFPDLVIANPPYKVADAFVRKALEVAGYPLHEPRGPCRGYVAGKKATVAMLLRSTFLTPKKRRPLRKDFGLPDKLELERRPSFNRSGTDATEYAWLIWSPKRAGRYVVYEP